ncbi:MAG: methionyl-tRNA formyltransferase [Chitinophagaceae bacterium]|nr:methionyl-tRNA formyltransferase [Chitinophagaceae bacterium]
MTKKEARIIFIGTPDFAVASLEALIKNNFNVVAVLTAPDKAAGRGMQVQMSAVKQFALLNKIPVLQPISLKDETFQNILASYKADVQVVVAFRMLPEKIWNMPPLGTFNVHGSLLPKYRGAAPIQHAIINGESETGVTTFKLKHEIDTGDILLQKKIPILEEDNFESLYNKLQEAGANLIVETLEKLFKNELIETPQIFTDDLPIAPKIFKEFCEIKWQLEGKKIINFIKGLSPYPAAFTILNSKKMKIFSAVFVEENHGKENGKIESDQKTFLKFSCANGWIFLHEIQLEGKKKMHVDEFLRGYKLDV